MKNDSYDDMIVKYNRYLDYYLNVSNKKINIQYDILKNKENIYYRSYVHNNVYNKDASKKVLNILKDIKFDRVIIDEAHELLKPSETRFNKNILNNLINLNAKYKWLITATPIFDSRFMDLTINYLCSKELNIYKELNNNEIEWILKYIYRKNYKNATKEIYIPNIKEETFFIEQSEIEKTIYNFALNDNPDNTKRLMQLCTHILVSEEEIKSTNYAINKIST